MNKTEVLAKIDDRWRRLTDLVDGIDPSIFVKPAKDDWSPKDHVAHLTAWEEFLLAILEKRDRYLSMGMGDVRGKETNEINEAVFRARRNLAPEAVRTAFADTHGKVRLAIESFADADLQRPRADFQPEADEGDTGDESIMDEIGWNTWGHYDMHIEWIAAMVRT